MSTSPSTSTRRTLLLAPAFLLAMSSPAQQSAPTHSVIVQPGAPGQLTRTLPADRLTALQHALAKGAHPGHTRLTKLAADLNAAASNASPTDATRMKALATILEHPTT